MTFIGDAFTYPFRGGGKYILLIGGALSLIQMIVGFAGWVVGMIAWFILFGYFSSVYFGIIQSTATGSDEAPQFPTVTDALDDLIMPMVSVLWVGLLSFGAFIYLTFNSAEGEVWHLWVVLAGCFYFPMGILAVAVLGSLGNALPHRVIPGIFRGGLLYLLIVGLLILLYKGGGHLKEYAAGLPYVGFPLLGLIGMYVMMVNGRLLGLLYRRKEERLGWL